MAQNNTNKRQQLFRLTPLCFWCGKLTRLTTEMKHDTATVDHLYSRLHPDRKAARRGRGRCVLACNQCNKDRGLAETRGLMFVPRLAHRRPIAELTTVTPVGAPVYKRYGGYQLNHAVENPPKETKQDFGWIDNNGDLRPRSWEEYLNYKSAFIGSPFQDRVKPSVKRATPRRASLCTIGELLQYAQQDLIFAQLRTPSS